MKKIAFYPALAVAISLGLASCQNDSEFLLNEGEGTVYVSAAINTDVKVKSRATADELAESAMIWISNSKGVVRQFATADEIPAGGIRLVVDSYVAEAWAGDSVPASFTDRYFKGSQSFTLDNGDRKSVEIVCRLANSVVTVSYADGLDDVISDYTFTVGHSQGSLEFVGRDDRKGYFMMNSRDKDLQWTLTATVVATGEKYTRSGSIDACRPATQYNVKISGEGDVSEIGGGYLSVTVDPTEVESEDVIEITAAPEIRGFNFDLGQAVRGSRGDVGRHSLWIASSTSAITSLILESDYFSGKYGLEEGETDFDFLTLPETGLKSQLAAAGINYVVTTDSERGLMAIKLNFEERFMNALPDGDYAFKVTATDLTGKTVSATMTVIVSDATVTTVAATPSTVHSYSATIYGEINKADAANARLQYRQKGASEWLETETVRLDSRAVIRMMAELTDLTPGAAYEYRAVADGFEGATLSFETEGTPQLPNCGFEDWHQPAKILFPYAEGGSMFWDTGNTGSSTMSKNVTMNDGSDKHSGNYSARLASQFVGVGSIGKFAAGNIFIGEYLKTDGTDGVLGWGRPWTTRPAKLRGWMKYTPVNITHSSLDSAPKGAPDTGIIYIALLDNSLKTFEGKQYPVIVKTKASERTLFSSSDSNVVGYGEVVFEGTTGDWTEFTVDINYVRDAKPSYILCTASASRYGDYFTGGNGSTLWLDDLELVYE